MTRFAALSLLCALVSCGDTELQVVERQVKPGADRERPIGCQDEAEPNDSLAQASSFFGPGCMRGMISSADGVDYFHVSFAPARPYVARIMPATFGLTVFDFDTQRARTVNGIDLHAEASDTYVLVGGTGGAAGRYTIIVE